MEARREVKKGVPIKVRRGPPATPEQVRWLRMKGVDYALESYLSKAAADCMIQAYVMGLSPEHGKQLAEKAWLEEKWMDQPCSLES